MYVGYSAGCYGYVDICVVDEDVVACGVSGDVVGDSASKAGAADVAGCSGIEASDSAVEVMDEAVDDASSVEVSATGSDDDVYASLPVMYERDGRSALWSGVYGSCKCVVYGSALVSEKSGSLFGRYAWSAVFSFSC